MRIFHLFPWFLKNQFIILIYQTLNSIAFIGIDSRNQTLSTKHATKSKQNLSLCLYSLLSFFIVFHQVLALMLTDPPTTIQTRSSAGFLIISWVSLSNWRTLIGHDQPLPRASFDILKNKAYHLHIYFVKCPLVEFELAVANVDVWNGFANILVYFYLLYQNFLHACMLFRVQTN